MPKQRAEVWGALYDVDPLYCSWGFVDSFKDTFDLTMIFANPSAYGHWIKYFRGLFVMACNLVYLFRVVKPAPRQCLTTNRKVSSNAKMYDNFHTSP